MTLIPVVEMVDSGVIPSVMAGLGPAIHVFAACIKERRRWPAHVVGLDPTLAGHDGLGGQQVNRCGG
jgi:hypothetical protein